MITLTVNPEKENASRQFTANKISIGKLPTTENHLFIESESLQEIHVLIEKTNKGFVVINQANDPFVTLNDIPFRKRAIESGNLLLIGKTSLLFTAVKKNNQLKASTASKELETVVDKVTEPIKQEPPPSISEKKIEKKPLPTPTQQEPLDQPASELKLPPTPPSSHTHRKEIKKSPLSKWKAWSLITVLLIATAGFILNGAYSRVVEMSLKNEIDAAREVSDVALALTYAQLNHIQPQQQNWTDPHFLQNNIHSVLTDRHEPFASIRNSGHILDGKYLLRIYYNRDMTRFVVIAQPEASLTQWLATTQAIVVDSRDMKLHKIKDLRPLNRLLVNVNSLSGETGKDIKEIIAEREVIPLKALADKENQNGFAPPKQLELMKINAENYIYNAPRYSQIGEVFLQTAIDLVNRPVSNSEYKKLADEAKHISKLPSAVLYTSKGMKVAIKAQKALQTLLPQESYLIGYLQFDENGKMLNSHLIFDLDAPKRHSNRKFTELRNDTKETIGGYHPLLLAANASEYLSQSNSYGNQEPKKFHPLVDMENPLYQELNTIARDRQDDLQEVGSKIIELIHNNNSGEIENFSPELHALITQYETKSEKLNKNAAFMIKKLYREHDFMPMSEFKEYVKAAGLTSITTSYIQLPSKVDPANNFSQEEFFFILDKITNSRSLKELHQIVTQSSRRLRLENIHDTSRLITYQNGFRTKVLDYINKMLLSPTYTVPPYELSDENRRRLSEILISSWISDPEEQNYYLSEFDLLKS